MKTQHYRFPGAKPFTADDSNVFYGREKDINRLTSLINSKRMITLYAESGMGKTSLINAGLIPALAKNNKKHKVLPIKVRFGLALDENILSNANYLVDVIIHELTSHVKFLNEKKLPVLQANTLTSLWSLVKLFEFNNVHLIFIFDQFEEVFSYTDKQNNVLKNKLLQLLSPTIPKAVDNIISERVSELENSQNNYNDEEYKSELNSNLEFIYSLIKAQFILVIREDKLGLLSNYTSHFPEILKDTYKLLPFTKEDAEKAIILPSEAEGIFESNKFTIKLEALERILKQLRDKKGFFDPYAIQLTCHFIERQLVIKNQKSIIELKDIPEESFITKKYINNTKKVIEERLNIRIDKYIDKIEKDLIDHDKQLRISMHAGKLFGDSNRVVTEFINEGLLKSERRGGIDYIELSHDRLIIPLLKDFEERTIQILLRKRILQIGLPIALAIGSTYAYIVYQNTKLEEERHKLSIEKNKLSEKLTTKQDSLKIYQNKNNLSNLANKYTDSARIFFALKEANRAQAAYNNALYSANAANDTALTINIGKEIQRNLSSPNQYLNNDNDQIINSAKKIFKIDIFYDERNIESSKKTAEYIFNKLSTNRHFIIRTRMLTVKKMNTNPKVWKITRNTIRFENNQTEKRLSDSIRTIINKDSFIRNNKKLLNSEIVREGYSSPNYLSIFIHH